jgi:hypothetical protein
MNSILMEQIMEKVGEKDKIMKIKMDIIRKLN